MADADRAFAHSWGAGAHEKYTQAVPTPGPRFDGLPSRAPPNRRSAAGPSTATITPRDDINRPPSCRETSAGEPSCAALTDAAAVPGNHEYGRVSAARCVPIKYQDPPPGRCGHHEALLEVMQQ